MRLRLKVTAEFAEAVKARNGAEYERFNRLLDSFGSVVAAVRGQRDLLEVGLPHGKGSEMVGELLMKAIEADRTLKPLIDEYRIKF